MSYDPPCEFGGQTNGTNSFDVAVENCEKFKKPESVPSVPEFPEFRPRVSSPGSFPPSLGR